MSSLRALIRAEAQAAVTACVAAQQWPWDGRLAFDVMRPPRPEHGDFSTNAALVLASALRKQGVNMAPRRIAEALLAAWPTEGVVRDRTVAGPGFVNMTVNPDWYRSWCADVVAAPERAGRLARGQGQKVQVEFVSANPTGPLHFGGARNAVLGDALARVLEAAGYAVQREFYVNDAGTQFELFVASLWAAYRQRLGQPHEFPPEGYAGAYMHAYAAQVEAQFGDALARRPEAEALEALSETARAIVLGDLEAEIGLLSIRFDRWFRERALHADGRVREAIARLTAAGATYEKDRALWFTASRYPGADQDVVLVRSTGEPTYFAADVAYHCDKLETRGFDRVIDVWSVDHQGHIPRMKAMLHALGLDTDRLHIVLYDLVKLVQDGQEVPMSKRSGHFLTLREVVAEVGPDAVRFMLLTRAPESVIEFDLDQAKAQDPDNPVYFVQYSHARLCSIQARARQAGLEAPRAAEDAAAQMRAHLRHPAEWALMKELANLPEEIEAAVKRHSPHNLTYYAMRLASGVNAFYRDCRVLDPDNRPLTQARLALCAAARIVLARVLFLIGVQAPESM